MVMALRSRDAPVGSRADQPPQPRQLELPVLFGGYRPPACKPRPCPRRRCATRAAAVKSVQLDFNHLLAELLYEDDQAALIEREIDAAQGEPAPDQWEEAEVRRLHLFLLERSLEVLADARTSAATVMEILAWMREPASVPVQGFSYPLCCALCGYDATELLEQVEAEVGRLHGLAAV